MLKEWEEVAGPEQGGDGLYVDRLKVPCAHIYKLEEWGEGGIKGKLISREFLVVPLWKV